jgi:transcriptional regulator with GAF, ATPase, and Fis domain
LNCAALPDNLLESELFGYERGAFTGAVQTKVGLLETAQGGTVFLDEVGELPMTTQAKLLRAIESREILRVGGLKARPIDVRFIAATHRDLEALSASQGFRSDLYFRLNGITIEVPPLRERAEEIPDLVRKFVTDACQKAGRPLLTVSGMALELLRTHMWPGNIRELRNVVERAVVLCTGNSIEAGNIMLGGRAAMAPSSTPRLEDSAPGVATPSSGTPAVAPKSAIAPSSRPDDRQRIIDALAQTGGNQTEAAKLLGIARRTLVNRLEEYDIPRPRKRGEEP